MRSESSSVVPWDWRMVSIAMLPQACSNESATWNTGSSLSSLSSSLSSAAHLGFIKQCNHPAVDRHDTVKGSQASLPGRTVLLHLVNHKMQSPLVAENCGKMRKYSWLRAQTSCWSWRVLPTCLSMSFLRVRIFYPGNRGHYDDMCQEDNANVKAIICI